MAVFKYTALTADGQQVKSTVESVSLAAADPSHGIGTLTITVGEGMVLTYDLPEGLLAGRSVVEEFDLH